ncbi:hypothetical protein Tco_0785187, partial [Tanacetum coccineum]
MKNNPVCKENASNVFRKEREQYHEIQDLKAQMQDKNIAISELKKLIENCKGKSVETQFNKPSVVRQPNAQRIPKPSVLGKPTPFSNSPEMRITQQNLPQIRKQAVRNTNVIAPGPSRNCPKHVSHQSPREKVGSNDMVHNYYLEKAKKSAQLQKDKEVNGKPSVIDPASSDLAPQRQEMSVENVSSGLVPQGQKASDYDNSDPVPPRQNVVPSAEKT